MAGAVRAGDQPGTSPAARANTDECARHLDNEQDCLDYPAFRTADWPVASASSKRPPGDSSRTRWKSPGPVEPRRRRSRPETALADNRDFDDYSAHMNGNPP
jgi:hypothetical protein